MHGSVFFHHLLHWIGSFHPLVLALFGGASAAVHRWRQRLRENRAVSWPSAEGVIQAVTVTARHGYWAEVSYRYYALQEYRYGKYKRHFRKKAAAEKFADSLRGRTVPIRFRDSDPTVSVVMERDLQLHGILQPQ